MSRVETGRQILRNAEQSLQVLLAGAATAGDYASLPILMEWARRIAKLASDPVSDSIPQLLPPASKQQVSNRLRKKSSGAKKTKSSGYPRFIRDEDFLVKIGWSKSEGGEYEHKAGKDAVAAVASFLANAGRRGKRFSMETLLPCKRPDGSTIPDYQSYLILAWLRSSGLVSQHGRLGYTVPECNDFSDAMESCWLRLPERSYNLPDQPR